LVAVMFPEVVVARLAHVTPGLRGVSPDRKLGDGGRTSGWRTEFREERSREKHGHSLDFVPSLFNPRQNYAAHKNFSWLAEKFGIRTFVWYKNLGTLAEQD
jgi:hypothetical protein